MAAKTKTMNQIRLILQHHAQGFSGRDIAQRLAISRNTVAHYLGRFAASGLSNAVLMALQDAALEAVCSNGLTATYGAGFPFRIDRTDMFSLVPMYRLTRCPAHLTPGETQPVIR